MARTSVEKVYEKELMVRWTKGGKAVAAKNGRTGLVGLVVYCLIPRQLRGERRRNGVCMEEESEKKGRRVLLNGHKSAKQCL